MLHLKRCAVGAVVVSVVASGWYFGSGSAVAQDRRGRGDRYARMLERHPEADTNGDGTLSEEEARAFFQARQGQGPGDRSGMWQRRGMFGPRDPAEILKRHPELDTNKDGVLSDEEMRAAREKFGRFGPDGGPFQPHPAFFDWLIERFEKADLDGNKQLSKDEILKLKEQCEKERKAAAGPGPGGSDERRQRLLKRYPEADTDGDGKLSDTEARAVREKYRERGSRGRRGRSKKSDTGEKSGAKTEKTE